MLSLSYTANYPQRFSSGTGYCEVTWYRWRNPEPHTFIPEMTCNRPIILQDTKKPTNHSCTILCQSVQGCRSSSWRPNFAIFQWLVVCLVVITNVIFQNSGDRKVTFICSAYCRMFETRADVMAMFEQFRSVDKADLVSFGALTWLSVWGHPAREILCQLSSKVLFRDRLRTWERAEPIDLSSPVKRPVKQI